MKRGQITSNRTRVIKALTSKVIEKIETVPKLNVLDYFNMSHQHPSSVEREHDKPVIITNKLTKDQKPLWVSYADSANDSEWTVTQRIEKIYHQVGKLILR